MTSISFQVGNNGAVQWAMGCDWPNGDIASVIDTGANCGTDCVNYSGCTHFTWTEYNGGTCWLKNSAVGAPVTTTQTDAMCGFTTTAGKNTGSGDVYASLAGLCSTAASALGGVSCPYAVGYDIATHLVALIQGDGTAGLWANPLSWQSGIGLWIVADWLTAVGGHSIDRLYFPIRYAADATAASNNNFVATGYTDDQAWWGNAVARLEQLTRSRGDVGNGQAQAQFVLTNNLLQTDSKCGGGIYWDPGNPSSTSKTTISAVLTMNLQMSINALQANSALVSGAVTLYNWLKSSGLLNAQTGVEQDGLDASTCAITNWTFSYEYGVLLQFLVRLGSLSGYSYAMTDAKVFAQHAVSIFANAGVYSDSCESGSCDSTGAIFRGPFFQGLAMYYQATNDQVIGTFIQNTYLAMLSTRANGQYPLAYSGSNTIQSNAGMNLIALFNDLALTVAATKLFTASTSADTALAGLLPFDGSASSLQACVCDDYACPFTHLMACFPAKGHENIASIGTSALLIGPATSVVVYAPNGGPSQLFTSSSWFVGNTWNGDIDSVDVNGPA
ncbi:hypothetical protein HK100_001324 [Physocladia obscura]|uniref:Mannan endo-1,6-alpha-mannosidase n=1 Tax=Physocladia obscura TaxID=109957 RepID=A0AAD5T2Y8_9FUNG|nr:hypothetical protein HK100_001324 [Physocladia obscura]